MRLFKAGARILFSRIGQVLASLRRTEFGIDRSVVSPLSARPQR